MAWRLLLCQKNIAKKMNECKSEHAFCACVFLRVFSERRRAQSIWFFFSNGEDVTGLILRESVRDCGERWAIEGGHTHAALPPKQPRAHPASCIAVRHYLRLLLGLATLARTPH